MSKRRLTDAGHADERSFLVRLMKRMAKRAASDDIADRPVIIEGLEDRLLMSISPVATPDFVIYDPAGTAVPAVSASPTGLTPTQVRHAYGIDSVMLGSIIGDGAGQTIAIVDAYNAPTIAADLHAFDLQFGLADPLLTVIAQDGTTHLPGTDPAGRGNSWAVETSLDVEWAHAVAPKANIVLVEAKSASTTDLFAAVDTARRYAGVSVVSMSWGTNEYSGELPLDAHFVTPSGHTGVTFVASSGDSGAYDPNTSTFDASYPAASPNVLSVGGTYLRVDASGNYISESGWGSGTSSGRSGGSGGGISRYENEPAYQRPIVTQTTTRRAVPDVAFLADPASGVAVIDSWDFGTSTPWLQVGGTSLAAPMWAGVIAIADEGRVLAGETTLDGASGTLPLIYSLPSIDFHDITSGNNGYAAGPGFDLVTGRGTPIVNLVVPGLVGTVQPGPAQPVIASLTTNPSTVTVGALVTLTASGVQETGGTISAVTFYRESNGVAGLQVGSDVLVGSGAQSGTTWSLATSTAGLAAPSTYTYYAVATDGVGVKSAPASAVLQVNAPAPAAPANNNFASGAVLSGSAATWTGTNVGATKEAGEPNHAGYAGGASVWFTWTATASGRVSLNTRGSNFDTLLAVYTGNAVSSLTAIASNDDERTNRITTSALTFNAVAGTTYHIAVDGYRAATGNIALNLSQAIAPANDNFANAQALTGNTFTCAGTNVSATKEAGEPNHAGYSGGASVWFTWTAASTRTVSLSTLGSSFDTLLAVYTGSLMSSLTPIASNDESPAGNTHTSLLTFNAVAGTTYRFAVDGYRAATGGITLTMA